MKRNIIPLTIIIVAIALIPSCEKGNDYYARQGATELKDCPITQIINYLNVSPDTLLFTYTAWGDPETVTTLHPQSWDQMWTFKYDKKRRLTEIIGMYADGVSGGTWHKYFYDNPGKGNITRDSLYLYFELVNGVLNCHHRYITFYFYDKYDRITRDSSIYLSYPATVQTYVYGANGNLAGRTYDNKINLYRTNKIWMFYNRDYSVNNPFVADSYNAAGLPTQLNAGSKNPSVPFFMYVLRRAQVEYGCRR